MININLLPKNLRRIREPGYWRLLAIAFPLLVLGAAASIQLFAFRSVQNLEYERQVRQDRLALLQPFLREQRELQNRQRQLRDLIAVAQEVREDRIIWSAEITSMLETLPARGDASRPAIDFRSLSMAAVSPPRSDENRYEGKAISAEMNVSGNVVDTEVLAEFVRALETSPNFGVTFQTATRQENGLFQYNLLIGALAEDE